MVATFWNLLFDYADEQKKIYGPSSPEYRTTHEIEDLLQKTYDECNDVMVEEMERKPKDFADDFLFRELPEVKLFTDKDGYIYELDNKHFESVSEVMHYVLADRRRKYEAIRKIYDKIDAECARLLQEIYESTKKRAVELLGCEEEK